MTSKFKGFGNQPSKASRYSFTKEKELLNQFIEQNDSSNLYRLVEGLVELHGEELAIDLFISVAKKFQPETFSWVKKVFSTEWDRARLEASVNPELNTRFVWQEQIGKVTGDLLKEGFLEIVGWNDGFMLNVTKKGKKYFASLEKQLAGLGGAR